MRAVVTGSRGFIGRHLVGRLHQLGYDVVGIDRLATPGGDWEHRIDLAAPSNRGDIADLVRPADVVFHLAARPGVRDSSPDIETRRHRDNVLATAMIMETLPPATPVVMTSSSSVYGSASRGADGLRPSREDDPVNPRGGYARSKVQAEEICLRRASSGGRVAVARPFTVAGEGQRPDMALSIWINAVVSGRPIRLFGSPERIRDVTDVRDVVTGLITIHQRSVAGIVNLGTGNGHRIIDMAQTVIETLGCPARIELSPGSEEEVDATLADTTRCADVLGFVPVTNLGDLVRRMVDAAPSTDLVEAVR